MSIETLLTLRVLWAILWVGTWIVMIGAGIVLWWRDTHPKPKLEPWSGGPAKPTHRKGPR